ncbi:MAG: thioredoxin family protein [Patescibacteria group bacterium]
MNKKIESIQVLGPGCPSCKKLFELTKQAVADLNLGIEVEYSDDIQKIIAMGVMSSPVLAVNNKVVLAGQLPSIEKIKNLLVNGEKIEPEIKINSCSCGGNC